MTKKQFTTIITMLLLAILFACGKVNEISAASRLTLSASKITLGVKENAKLTIPINLTGKTATYTSSDTDIVTVSSKGTLYGKAVGKAVVTVSAGKYKATCNVTVGKTKLKVEEKNMVIPIGTKQSITILKNSTKKSVAYKSGNIAVVTVDKNGIVKATGAGKTTVRVMAGDRRIYVNVTVPEPVLSLSEKKLKITEKETSKILITENTTGKQPTYKSSNTSVAKVSKTGTITAVKKGTATITVTSGSKKASVKVTVTKPKIYPTKIEFDYDKMDEYTSYDRTQRIKLKITPENASECKFSYESSDPNLATITDDGIIVPSGNELGSFTITVRSENGLKISTEHVISSWCDMIPNKKPNPEFDTTVLYKGKEMVDLGWTESQLVSNLGDPLRKEVNEYYGYTYVYRPARTSLLHINVNDGVVKSYLLVGSDLSSGGFYLGESREEINKLVTWGRVDSNNLGYSTDSYTVSLSMDNNKDGSLYMMEVYEEGYCAYQDVNILRGTNPSPEYIEMMTNEFIDIVNTFRAINGRGDLKRDRRVDAVATAHAKDMLENNYYDHVNLQGETPRQRLEKSGISTGRAVCENIGWLPYTVSDEVHGYICSSGHRSNFLMSLCTYVGVGFSFSEEDNHSVFIAK